MPNQKPIKTPMKSKEYDFTLKFALADPEIEPEIYVKQLGEAGCDDAIIGIGQKGRIALQFNREAPNAAEAILSAIQDVKRVIPSATLVEATPDLVGITDIADLMGFSRQNMRKLIITHSETFPNPIHEGSSSLWHLLNVFQWFESKQGKVIEAAVKEIAEVTMQINLAKAVTQLNSAFHEKISDLRIFHR